MTTTPASSVDERLASPHLAYREALAEGVLRYQRCSDCRQTIFPPRVVCPHCGSVALSAERSEGRGEVYSTTVVTQRDQPSYSVCLIDLDEGFRMMSTVTGSPAESVAIGQRVTLAIETGDPARATFVIEGAS